jgi:hypothetical protein
MFASASVPSDLPATAEEGKKYYNNKTVAGYTNTNSALTIIITCPTCTIQPDVIP